MRRLVPTVTETAAKIREYDAGEQADTASRLALVATIVETLAGVRTHMPGHCQSIGRSQVYVDLPGAAPYSNGGHLAIIGAGSEVTFERFRVHDHQAIRMLAVLADQQAPEAERVTGQLAERAVSYARDGAGREFAADQLAALAERYARDAARFPDAGRLGQPIMGAEQDCQLATVKRLVADELRKIVAAIKEN